MFGNAKILGWIKEVNVMNEERLQNRVKFLNECDAVITSGISDAFKNIDMFKYLRSVVDKEFYFISQPVNITYLFDNFYTVEKENLHCPYLVYLLSATFLLLCKLMFRTYVIRFMLIQGIFNTSITTTHCCH